MTVKFDPIAADGRSWTASLQFSLSRPSRTHYGARPTPNVVAADLARQLRKKEEALKKPPKKHGKKRPKKKPKPPAPAPGPALPWRRSCRPRTKPPSTISWRERPSGATPELVTQVRAVGWSQWLASQLDHDSIADPTGDTVRNLYPDMALTSLPPARQSENSVGTRCLPLGQGTLGLAIWSRRQLFEVMVDFWSNHLNVTNPSDRVWDNRADYDRTRDP